MILASAALLIGCFLYVFWPERHVEAQHAKTRLEYLRERREVLYDNLRDLNFEFRAGKYPAEDYAAQRALLENEAAETVAEIDLLESDALTPYQTPQHS
jgi:cbb3-type cytochrome oxidase subunit 3